MQPINRYSKRLAFALALAMLSACGADDEGGGNAGTGGAGGMTGGTGGIAGMTGGTGGSAGLTGGVGGMTGGAGGMTGGVGGMTGGVGGMTGGTGGAAGVMMGGMGGMTGGTGGMTGGTGGMMAGGTFTLTSTSATEGMELDTRFRCVSLGGETGPSPALMWANPPAGTMSFAITFTDKSTGFSAEYAHWTIFDIPAATTMLAEGVAAGATTMPSPAKQSTNSAFLAPTNGYSGPCGTNTTPNPYEFKIWALDVATLPDVTSSSARDAVLTALEAHDVGTATLTVTSTAP